MAISKNIEEALSYVWEFKERNIDNIQEMKERLKDKIGLDLFAELIEKKYIIQTNEKVSLSKEGRELAADIIRRQRLAERLLADVLEIKGELMDSVACEFEHIISPEVEKSICTLLGHPKLCPHGSVIPSGDCCHKQEEVVKSIITTLDKFSQGETCRIVYMLTHAHPELHKLLSLGVVPGATVKIHQTFPTLVVKIEEEELALDKEIAKNIYVKKNFR
jgi:DtxR family Mn-dependent transcriptional regulator